MPLNCDAGEDFFFLILFYFLTLQYCVGFAIYQHESAKEIKPVNLKENQP